MKIYKYTPHIIDFIENCSLKFTPPYQLNDPFELKLTSKFLEDSISAVREIPIFTPKSNIFERAVKEHSLYYGVLSLSRKWDDLKMWGHYTSNFSGGVIEFEISDPPKFGKVLTAECDLFDDFEIYGMRNVIYSKNRPHFKGLKNIHTTLLDSFFRKPAQWKHENEFRIIGSAAHPNFFKMSKDIYKDIFEKEIKGNSGDFFILSENSTEIFISRKEGCNPIRSIGFVKKLFDDQRFFHPLVRINPLRVTALYLGMNFDPKILKNTSLDKFKKAQSSIFMVQPDAEKYVLNITATVR
ncbi:DUF2971 domain-containing protein [Aquaspirillum soli]